MRAPHGSFASPAAHSLTPPTRGMHIPPLSGAQARRSGSSKLDGLRRAPARQLVRDVLGKARNRLESGSPYVI